MEKCHYALLAHLDYSACLDLVKLIDCHDAVVLHTTQRIIETRQPG